jgi:hypothetical protein
LPQIGAGLRPRQEASPARVKKIAPRTLAERTL